MTKIKNKLASTILYVIIPLFSYLLIITKFKFDIYFFDTDYTLDSSWIYAFNNLNSLNLTCGKNLFFTYGPLGMLLNPIGNHILLSIFFTLIIYFIDCFILISQFKKTKNNACIYLIVFLSLIYNINSPSTFIIFSLCVLSLGSIYSKHNYIFFIILCFLSSLLFLIKFDLAIVSLLMITAIFLGIAISHVFFPTKQTSCDNIYAKPEISVIKIFLIFLSLPFLCIVEYLIYNPSLNDCLNYYKYMLILSSEYSSAMVNGFPDLIILEIFPAALFLFSLQLVSLYFKNINFIYWVLVIPVLYVYKASVVRCDYGHYCNTPNTLRIIYILSLLSILPILSSKIRFLFSLIHSPQLLTPKIQKIIRKFSNIFSIMITLLFFLNFNQSMAYNHEIFGKFQVSMYLPSEIQTLIENNTVTVYPWDILWNETADINYQGFPSLQSYVAYIPDLDKKNKDFFIDENAPTFILFENQTIDNRLIAWEAPQTFMAINSNYFFTGKTASFKYRKIFLLEKKKECTQYEYISESAFTSSIFETIMIPESEYTKTINFQIKPSILYKIKGLFFRNEPLYATITYANGEEYLYRMILPNMESELPLDFIIPGEETIKKITQIKFSGKDLSLLSPEIKYTITYYSLH